MRHPFALALIALATTLMPTQAGAAASTVSCSCSVDDGLFQYTDSVSMDTSGNGDTSDWEYIHNDPDQNVCDDSSGNDEDGDGVDDRDTIVQSTGRDLEHFAFGWDQTLANTSLIKFYTGRYASTSNTQSFAYYGDIDGDNLIESTDLVIGVTWQGSNRTISVQTFEYTPADTFGFGGDCIHDVDPTDNPDVIPDTCDGTGLVDGYNMEGTLSNAQCSTAAPFNNSKCEAKTGENGGVQMEFAITWNDAHRFRAGGTSPGLPIVFHVASSNATLTASSWPDQIDDNLGGCGGLIGSSQYPTADCNLLGNSQQATTGTAPPADAFADITHANYSTEMPWFLVDILNDGNGVDTFDITIDHPNWPTNLAVPGAQEPSIEVYLDDGDGIFEPGGDDGSAITDTNGAANIFEATTAALDPNYPSCTGTCEASYFVQVELTALTGVYDPIGISDIDISFASQYQPGGAGTCTINTEVDVTGDADLSITKMAFTVSDPLGGNTYQLPGSVMRYQVDVSAQGGEYSDTDSVVFSDIFAINNDGDTSNDLLVYVLDRDCNGDTDTVDPVDRPICFTETDATGYDLTTGGDATIEWSTTLNPDVTNDAHWSTSTPTNTGGYAAGVTGIRISFAGQFNPVTVSTDPAMQMTYLARIP